MQANETLEQQYETIYLSPHLDDVALSCGGQIYQQTEASNKVLIVTLMAGYSPIDQFSDYARSLHDRWQVTGETVAIRRKEDAEASFILGADLIHWNVPDCIYRRDQIDGTTLYPSETALFGQLHPSDSELLNILVKRLTELPKHGKVVVPLSIGHHVDHQLTRQAAELWQGATSLYYYEDYPYAQDKKALVKVVRPEDEWQAQVITLTHQALMARIEAIAKYRSQISTFFNDIEDLSNQVMGYCQQVGGERLWRYVPK